MSAAIKVMAEEAKEVKGQLELLLNGYDLANRAGWFGTNQAYYVLSKARGDGAWAPCARSVVVRGGANPNWPFLRLPMQRLCNGDLNRPLRLEVRHDEGGEAFANVGHATVTAGQLQTANFSVALSHPRGKDKPVGTCAVQLTRVVEEPTFLAYVAGGLELRLMVGVDFSYFYGADEPGGQSKLRKVDSADAGAPNPYETVLRTLGAVLAPCACFACLPSFARQLTAYAARSCADDADGKIPCYGFGGVLPGGCACIGCPRSSACADAPDGDPWSQCVEPAVCAERRRGEAGVQGRGGHGGCVPRGVSARGAVEPHAHGTAD